MTSRLQTSSLAHLILVMAFGCGEGPPAAPVAGQAGPPAMASPGKAPGAAKTHDELTDSDTPNVSQPLELLGQQVGSLTLEEFKKTVPPEGAEWFEEPGSPKASAKLRDGGTFAGKPVKDVSYSFYDGVLLSIHLAPVTSSDAGWIRDQLAEKYGPPDELAPLSVWRDDRATLFLVENRDLLLFDRRLGRKTVTDQKGGMR